MGSAPSDSKSGSTSTDYRFVKDPNAKPYPDVSLETYQLLKDEMRCTGLFWRPDPRGGNSKTGSNWPHDAALLAGTVFSHNGEKWLDVKFKKEYGTEKWEEPNGPAAFIPFRHDQHFLVKIE